MKAKQIKLNGEIIEFVDSRLDINDIPENYSPVSDGQGGFEWKESVNKQDIDQLNKDLDEVDSRLSESIANIEDTISEVTAKEESTNKVYEVNENKYCDISGNIGNDGRFFYTNKVKVPTNHYAYASHDVSGVQTFDASKYRYCCVYNEDGTVNTALGKQFSNFFENTSGTDKYVVFCGYMETANHVMVEVTDHQIPKPSEYDTYASRVYVPSSAVEKLDETIVTSEELKEKIKYIVFGSGLNKVEDISLNSYVDVNGNKGTDPRFYITNMIPVSANHFAYCSTKVDEVQTFKNCRYITVFNADGTPISSKGKQFSYFYQNDTNDEQFVIFTGYAGDENILVEITSNLIPKPSNYEPFKSLITMESVSGLTENIKDLKNRSVPSWYEGKKLVSFGDSITAQAQWQSHVVEKMGFARHTNCGIGGTTVAEDTTNSDRYDTSGNAQWMSSDYRISTIPSDTDVILVFGGHNDWGHPAIPYGAIGNGKTMSESSGFKNAYALMIKKLITRFPNAHIITMTPVGGRTSTESANQDMQMYLSHDVEGESTLLCMTDFAKAVKEVSEYYGIPCIDVGAESGISTLNHTTYIADVIHPNSEGGKRIANTVINGLKRYEPIDL